MNALIPLAAVLLSAGDAGQAQVISGRGVHYADATVQCPLAAPLGTRGAQACIRLALYDDKSTFEVDPEKHRIIVRNAAAYPEKTLVADVLLPAWSQLKQGRSPAAVHLLVRKKGKTFLPSFHAHAMSREVAQGVELEPYEIVASDGATEKTLLTPEAGRKAVLDPGLAAKLAGELVEVTDNLPTDEAKDGEPKPVGDVTVALGLGPAAKDVARAQLFRSGNDTELRIIALSGLIPKDVIRRELVLYGVDELPNLAEVKKRGLKSGEALVVAMRDGKGTLRVGKTSAEMPDAANSIRGFLEGNFVGALLAHQAKLDVAH